MTLPGSKSITNRFLLLAALSQDTSHLRGALKSDDTRYMADALCAMGVQIDEPDSTSFRVTGSGKLTEPSAPLFVGNAGTAARFLTAAAALVDGKVTVTGDAHMSRRPIGPLVSALGSLGVEIAASNGCPPVTIKGGTLLKGGKVAIDAGLSSQYASAMLMLAPRARTEVEIALRGAEIGARGYIDMSCAAMRHFGVKVEQKDAATWLVHPATYQAADLQIEPDASAATYLWAAEVLTDGAIDLGATPKTLTQPDAAAYALIRSFPNMPAMIDGSQMQDAVPTLAVLAAFNATPVRFVGVSNLRGKECDRIAALASELSRLCPGLAVESNDDLVVTPFPVERYDPAIIETYSDHRIAMSMSLIGLRVSGIGILDPDCVRKTYPAYWHDMTKLGVGTTISWL